MRFRLALLGVVLGGCGPSLQLVDANGVVLRECRDVEYATTPSARQQGLGARTSLTPDQALVLRYPVVDEACITNAPVGFPIATLFVDAAGAVIAVERFEARESKARCHPGVLDVVEVDATLPDGVSAVRGLRAP